MKLGDRFSKRISLDSVLLTAVYVIGWVVFLSIETPHLEVMVFSALLGCTLIVLSVVDVETFLLPDPLVAALAVAGAIMCIALGNGMLVQNIAAAAVIGILVLIVDGVYFRIRGRHGIGMGDAKLLAAGAIWVGAGGILTAILWACLTGLAHCLAEATFRQRLTGSLKIPFGPHIALGIWLVWLFGSVQ